MGKIVRITLSSPADGATHYPNNDDLDRLIHFFSINYAQERICLTDESGKTIIIRKAERDKHNPQFFKLTIEIEQPLPV